MALREERETGIVKTVDQVIREHVDYVIRTHKGAPNSYIARTLGWSRSKLHQYAKDNDIKLTSAFGNKALTVKERYEKRRKAFAEAAADISDDSVADGVGRLP